MFLARCRSQLGAGAVVLVALTLLAACEWPQSRYGPGNTGFNPSETTINATNVSGLGIRWSQQLPAGPRTPPVIANGVLYASSGKLYAFDASTGSARWSSEVLGWTESSPAVASGIVYVSAFGNGVARLRAFDAGGGKQLWSQTIGSVTFSPTVANGVVYVTGDKLYAFNAATGARLWSASAASGYLWGSPAVANGVVYVGGDKGLRAFNAATGAQLWSKTTAGPSAPAVANGVVYVGNETLYAFNATTGAQLWSANSGSGDGASPAVANGVVYVGGDKLYALSAATGAQLWTADPDPGFISTGPAAVANGVVYAGADGLYAYNATTGAPQWSDPGGGGTPVVANGVVYAGDTAYSLPSATPTLSISPAFPSDYVFGEPTSTTRTFTITNIGSRPTSGISDSISGPDAADFHLTSDGCAGTTLGAGATCTVSVSFAATASVPRTARLTSTAAAGGTATAILAGTAQPFALSPPWIDFGGRLPGSPSPDEVFTLTNLTGGSVGPITSSLSGGGFTITADACAEKILADRASCTVAVRFAPTFIGSHQQSLITQAPGYRAESTVYGMGLSQLSVAPTVLDFGQIPAGTTALASVTIKNVSPTPAGPITNAIDEGSPRQWFSITSDTCAGKTLAPGASCTVEVRFAPISPDGTLIRLRTILPAGETATWLIGRAT